MERISSYYSLEHLVQTLEELGVPEEYICPITQDFMRDPCLAEDGHTYERAAIEEWLRRHGTSPITREVISAERLMPDPTLRKMIEDFCGEKRQLFLSWREREKAQLPSASPHARGQPATAQCDQDEDGDVVEHPYATDGIAESEPLMGASECDGPQQARSKRESLTHSQARPKKGSSSSRSSHNQNTVTSPPSGATRPSSCWVCTLF